MGNDIKIVISSGSDYWAAHVGGEKIKRDRFKQQTRTDVITHWWPTLPLHIKMKNNKKLVDVAFPYFFLPVALMKMPIFLKHFCHKQKGYVMIWDTLYNR